MAEGLRLNEAYGHHAYVASCLEGIAAVAADAGGFTEARKAARVCAAAEALRDSIGAPLWPADRTRLMRFLAAARERVGEDVFTAAWGAGRTLTAAEARAEALALLGAPPEPERRTGNAGAGFGLTRREIEVLQLVKSGMTDREIAEALFISPRTTQNHVAKILAKLNVRTRILAVDLATAHGLLDRPE